MKQPKADGRTDMKCYHKGVFRIAILLLTTVMVLMGCGNSKSVSVENDVVIMYTPSDVAESITSDSSESEESITKSSESAGTNQSDLSETVGNTVTNPGEKVRIIMAGDILLHERVSDSGAMPDGTYNYNHLFANLKQEITSADLALVNQEVILGGREIGLSGYPSFNGAYEVGDALMEAGFDVVLHATNHALDRGKIGLLNCISYWKTTHPDIGVLGIQESKEEQEVVYIKEVNGIRIAILNYTYGTNGIPLPSDMPFAVNLLDKARVAADVAKVKESAEFIIVCPHWGTEYIHGISDYQREWAEYFASLGVNLVLGTHPHVIEPVEWIGQENGNGGTLVYYSIGNFINATNENGSGVGDRMLGALAEVTIQRNPDGLVTIVDYGVLPTVTHLKTGAGQITTYKLQDYTESLALENEILNQDSGFSYQHCVELCREVFGALYTE